MILQPTVRLTQSHLSHAYHLNTLNILCSILSRNIQHHTWDIYILKTASCTCNTNETQLTLALHSATLADIPLTHYRARTYTKQILVSSLIPSSSVLSLVSILPITSITTFLFYPVLLLAVFSCCRNIWRQFRCTRLTLRRSVYVRI